MTSKCRTVCLLACLCLIFTLPVSAAERVVITVKGVEGEALKNILTSLNLQKQKDHPRLTERRIKRLYKKAPEEIRLALQALGYYQPKIQSQLTRKNGVWHARYTIDPGPPVRVGEMDIQILGEGADDPAFQKLLSNLPLKEGEVLHHGRYEKSKRALQKLAVKRGYFDADFRRHRVEVDLKKYRARVLLYFDTGVRYRFGEVSFSPSPIRVDKLKLYQPFVKGDPYLNDRLIAFQKNLFNTDFFDEVIVQPLPEATSDHAVPVRVTLVPRKRNRYTAGIGFGTDTGPRLKLGWDARYTRHGHRMGAAARISPVLSTLSTHYTLPHFRKQDAELGFNAGLSRTDTGTSKSHSLKAGINHRQKRWGWNEIAGIDYLYENFDVSDQTETSKLMIPAIGWTKTETDNPAYTRNGFRLALNLRGAVAGLLSDLSFAQATLDAKYIRSFWDAGRMIFRGNLGLTSVSNFDRLPTSLRYFAGGDYSIRGFDYEDLGPRDDKGKVIGGKYRMVGSIEYEHRILEKWSVAGFVDAGNAFNRFGNEIEVGTGFGIRWLSPVGQIRIDLAMGISEPGRPIRLHINIGPDL